MTKLFQINAELHTNLLKLINALANKKQDILTAKEVNYFQHSLNGALVIDEKVEPKEEAKKCLKK